MCAAAASEPAVDRNQIALWLDDYRDGSISEADARRLAAIILARNDDSAWIMEELAFDGLLAQSLHDVDEESFVRAFVERLTAESDGDRTERVIRGSTARFRAARQAPPPSWLQASLQGLFARRTQAAGGRSLPAFRLYHLVAVAVAVGLTVAIVAIGRLLLAGADVGQLEEATPGVVIHRDAGRLLPAIHMRLRSGDAVRVPQGGRARVEMPPRTSLVLLNDSALSFPAQSGSTGDGAGVELLAGELEARIDAAEPPLHLSTPHARIRCGSGGLRLSVTAASSRVECQKGELLVVRTSDGQSLSVPAGSSAIIVPGMPLRLSSDK